MLIDKTKQFSVLLEILWELLKQKQMGGGNNQNIYRIQRQSIQTNKINIFNMQNAKIL